MSSIAPQNDHSEASGRSESMSVPPYSTSGKGERLMVEFLKFRDMLQASDATPAQKKELWSQFLTLYTGVI